MSHNSPQMRAECAAALAGASPRTAGLKAFLGLDGFVDEILHVVNKRESAIKYDRVPTISKYAERLAAAAGKSTNIELVSQLIKLGGNGPIMANALASFGMKVTYLGNLGYPNLHKVFEDFTRRAQVHSIAEPGYTDALEFEDGKIMQGKHQSLSEVTWENIKARYGLDRFTQQIDEAQFVGFVNWTMLTAMNEIWVAVQNEVCPRLNGARRRLFVDLADPEKRTDADIARALQLLSSFEKSFRVILGLNQKESSEIGRNLGLPIDNYTPEALLALAEAIRSKLGLDTVVIHPTSLAVASSEGDRAIVEGAFTKQPLITTGAGDHFNAGFCLGKLLGFDNASSLLTGVTTSGFYVRTARSPSVHDLENMMQNWPTS